MTNAKGKQTNHKQQADEDSESGMFLEKEDIQLIYNALSAYNPTEREEQLHSVLLEEFEELLAVDFAEVSVRT